MPATADPRVPVYQEYMNPILEALRSSDVPLSIEDLDKRVIDLIALPPEVLAIPHGDGPQTEVQYRIAWARTYLKKAGHLANPSRGQWAVTEQGRGAGAVDAFALSKTVSRSYDERTLEAELERDDAGPEETPGSTSELVDEALAAELRALHSELEAGGLLLPEADAQAYLARFRERFGPQVLAGLDGEALLTRMHGRGAKDSLTYWLEFKDDEDFSTTRFGSIAGGSALKFGIYQTAETNTWMEGSSRAQVRLSIEEAASRARTQRDQLVAGARVLERHAAAGPVDHEGLQRELAQLAPDLAESAWGHKYFCLLFPDLIAPFHASGYQRYQLIKLQKLPLEGRYENGRYFTGAARQLGLSLGHLATVLHRRAGAEHAYWRIGTVSSGQSEWARMEAGGFVGVNWDKLGDLSTLPADAEGRDTLRRLCEQHHPAAPAVVTRGANELFHFVHAAQERDLVVAMEGARVLGVGRIAGAYTYQPGDGSFPHRRPVEWLARGEWRLPLFEGLRRTFVRLGKHPENLIAIERRVAGTHPHEASAASRAIPETKTEPAPRALAPLTGIPARIHSVLQRKRQLILYGPPGTGKTYWAEKAAVELASRAWFGREAGRDEAERKTAQELKAQGAIETCAFHPAYGYEDFLEGYRPIERDGTLAFVLREGLFKRLCARASATPERPFFLIIDELNRGDVPRIFGELLTVLEKEKRGRPITLPLTGEAFAVPDNVFILATMNTADRSIALLDAALRRRFGFLELLPDSRLLRGASVGGLPLGPWLDELNRRVVRHLGRDAHGLQVGHSYLMPSGAPVRDVGRFCDILRDELVPLLEEYCYDDREALQQILGGTLVRGPARRIDDGLFEPARHRELIDALLAAFESITATAEAVEADASEAVAEPEPEPDEEGGQEEEPEVAA